MLLKGMVSVLTGSGRINSIGAATARLLARNGSHVVINCLNSKEQAEKVVSECSSYGVSSELFVGDITNTETCKSLATFVKDKFGRVDTIVNCVGATKPASYENLELLNAADFMKLFSVNVIGPYLMAQAFQSMLRESKIASIVNVSSTAALTGISSSIAYATSKGAENSLTLALAQALSPEVRVNAVCPSFVDSSWWETPFKDKKDKYEALVESMKEKNLLKRVIKPEDVALTILSVIQNPVMTGEIIRLDAGAHIGKSNSR